MFNDDLSDCHSQKEVEVIGKSKINRKPQRMFFIRVPQQVGSNKFEILINVNNNKIKKGHRQ